MAGFLRPGVADIEVVDACGEAADPRCPSGIWIGLGRARAEPTSVSHIGRQVQSDTDPRPRAVPVVRRYDVDVKAHLRAVELPSVADVDQLRTGRGA
jgi:hypothetical protein